MSDVPADAMTLAASIRDGDEFWQGVWWVPTDHGGVRSASLGECCAEIIRLRERLATLERGP